MENCCSSLNTGCVWATNLTPASSKGKVFHSSPAQDWLGRQHETKGSYSVWQYNFVEDPLGRCLWFSPATFGSLKTEATDRIRGWENERWVNSHLEIDTMKVRHVQGGRSSHVLLWAIIYSLNRTLLNITEISKFGHGWGQGHNKYPQ